MEDHERLNSSSCELTELYDQMLYGFQVLKKFGDVVWQLLVGLEQGIF